METIEYFKLQAKNLFEDYKTQKTYFDSSVGSDVYEYAPKFFDVDALVTDFDINEDDFTLMNAQHIIAKLAGFEKWTEMLQASPPALELAKLLFDNMHKITPEEWEYYLLNVEDENDIILDDDTNLEIFQTVFADVDGHQTTGYDYRLAKNLTPPNETEATKPEKKPTRIQFSVLPLADADLKDCIEAANEKFEDLLQVMEPKRPEVVRTLWNPKKYIDEVLTPDKLPIDRDYALSIVQAFLVHHFFELDSEADKLGITVN